ncbi:hypothetical protein NE237_022742 [Protea cynaroides]|uniref:Pentatricopeptide repeat-containing protein n=1 Tax=Protea cynaroides TaxID=273540 RepID=A0A9Q0HB00_9MAGN|nr:hypothetical protein NE237_022742 [Protea cynaroides]
MHCKPRRICPSKSNILSSMRVLASVVRPISQFSSKPRIFSLSFFTLESAVSNEILTILDTVHPIEDQLETLVPFLSPDVVTSVLQENQNVGVGFRFFIWAMRRKQFRSWVSHNLMTDKLCGANGIDLAWKSLEDLKNSGFPIVPQAFVVLIQAYAKSAMPEKAVESFGRMEEFGCRPNTFTYNSIIYVLVEKGVLLLALAVYNQMLKSDCRPNRATFGMLINASCEAGNTHDALQLFDEMAQRDWVRLMKLLSFWIRSGGRASFLDRMDIAV